MFFLLIKQWSFSCWSVYSFSFNFHIF